MGIGFRNFICKLEGKENECTHTETERSRETELSGTHDLLETTGFERRVWNAIAERESRVPSPVGNQSDNRCPARPADQHVYDYWNRVRQARVQEATEREDAIRRAYLDLFNSRYSTPSRRYETDSEATHSRPREEPDAEHSQWFERYHRILSRLR